MPFRCQAGSKFYRGKGPKPEADLDESGAIHPRNLVLFESEKLLHRVRIANGQESKHGRLFFQALNYLKNFPL